MERREMLKSVSGLAAVSTLGLAGCSGILENEEEPSEAGTGCQTPGEDLTAAFPTGDAYEQEHLSEFDGEPGPGIRSSAAIYSDEEDRRYEFFITEYEDAEAAENSPGIDDYEGDGVPGYIVVDNYGIGADGPTEEELIVFMKTSPILSGCVESNIQLS